MRIKPHEAVLGGRGRPFLSSSASLDLVRGRPVGQRLLPEEDAPRGTGDCGPLGPVSLACSAEMGTPLEAARRQGRAPLCEEAAQAGGAGTCVGAYGGQLRRASNCVRRDSPMAPRSLMGHARSVRLCLPLSVPPASPDPVSAPTRTGRPRGRPSLPCPLRGSRGDTSSLGTVRSFASSGHTEKTDTQRTGSGQEEKETRDQVGALCLRHPVPFLRSRGTNHVPGSVSSRLTRSPCCALGTRPSAVPRPVFCVHGRENGH